MFAFIIHWCTVHLWLRNHRHSFSFNLELCSREKLLRMLAEGNSTSWLIHANRNEIYFAFPWFDCWSLFCWNRQNDLRFLRIAIIGRDEWFDIIKCSQGKDSNQMDFDNWPHVWLTLRCAKVKSWENSWKSLELLTKCMISNSKPITRCDFIDLIVSVASFSNSEHQHLERWNNDKKREKNLKLCLWLRKRPIKWNWTIFNINKCTTYSFFRIEV